MDEAKGFQVLKKPKSTTDQIFSIFNNINSEHAENAEWLFRTLASLTSSYFIINKTKNLFFNEERKGAPEQTTVTSATQNTHYGLSMVSI